MRAAISAVPSGVIATSTPLTNAPVSRSTRPPPKARSTRPFGNSRRAASTSRRLEPATTSAPSLSSARACTLSLPSPKKRMRATPRVPKRGSRTPDAFRRTTVDALVSTASRPLASGSTRYPATSAPLASDERSVPSPANVRSGIPGASGPAADAGAASASVAISAAGRNRIPTRTTRAPRSCGSVVLGDHAELPPRDLVAVHVPARDVLAGGADVPGRPLVPLAGLAGAADARTRRCTGSRTQTRYAVLAPRRSLNWRTGRSPTTNRCRQPRLSATQPE